MHTPLLTFPTITVSNHFFSISLFEQFIFKRCKCYTPLRAAYFL